MAEFVDKPSKNILYSALYRLLVLERIYPLTTFLAII